MFQASCKAKYMDTSDTEYLNGEETLTHDDWLFEFGMGSLHAQVTFAERY
jgi:hypothetical protein